MDGTLLDNNGVNGKRMENEWKIDGNFVENGWKMTEWNAWTKNGNAWKTAG